MREMPSAKLDPHILHIYVSHTCLTSPPGPFVTENLLISVLCFRLRKLSSMAAGSRGWCAGHGISRHGPQGQVKDGWGVGKEGSMDGIGSKGKRIDFLFTLAGFDGFCGELSRICCLYYWEIGALHLGTVSQSSL